MEVALRCPPAEAVCSAAAAGCGLVMLRDRVRRGPPCAKHLFRPRFGSRASVPDLSTSGSRWIGGIETAGVEPGAAEREMPLRGEVSTVVQRVSGFDPGSARVWMCSLK
ncbi:hypothetical protein NL676_032319 [Syzygium grande]|nr:hypothetical protein NL676_032319 [Syzygium grande]